MNNTNHQIDQKRQDRKTLLGVLVLLLLLALMILGLLALTISRINAYAEIPTAISGELKGIEKKGYAIDLQIEENTYRIKKESRLTKRTFGIIDDLKVFPLKEALNAEVGKTVYLEYVHTPISKTIVQLSIDGVVYVNKDVAIADFIGSERTSRTVCIVWLCAVAIVFVFVWKAMKKICPENAA